MRPTSDWQNHKSESTVSLDLYFVFIFVTAGNAVSHVWQKAIKF